MDDYPRCVMCGDPAAVKVELSHGCYCRPNDREQWLCPQHLNRISPLGTMDLVEDLRVGGEVIT